jgi:hypothetical protein
LAAFVAKLHTVLYNPHHLLPQRREFESESLLHLEASIVIDVVGVEPLFGGREVSYEPKYRRAREKVYVGQVANPIIFYITSNLQ